MRVPFSGPSYTLSSVNAQAQRTVNWYLKVIEAGEPPTVCLFPTPGLRLLATVGDGPIRGCIKYGAYLYVVSGNGVYRVNGSWESYFLGTINSSAGQVSMATNGTQVCIVDGANGYIVTIATGAVAIITDAEFPAGSTIVNYFDQYFVFTGTPGQSFQISSLGEGADYDGLDFASAEGAPDDLVSSIVDHRELWLFGTDSCEVWMNTGNSDFPFERSGNVFLETGCSATHSVAKLDNSIFWLGSNANGDGMVFRADGYKPVRISTHAIEHAIHGYSTTSDAIAYTYQQEGHSFYVLTFPTADKTWVYDVSTGQWHERMAFDSLDNTEHRHWGNCHAYYSGCHVVGDYRNGKLYALDLEKYTDNGSTIKRIRRAQTKDNDLQRVFYHLLEIDVEAGVSGTMMLRWSNDGGHTWSNYKTASFGNTGEYEARCRFLRLGEGRARVWEITVTDAVKAIVLGAIVNATEGGS
jgi:hypothetical protein